MDLNAWLTFWLVTSQVVAGAAVGGLILLAWLGWIDEAETEGHGLSARQQQASKRGKAARS